jgi:hypothetical protein
LDGVEGGRTLPCRRVHHDVLEPRREGVHERLDPTGARRKVVCDDQRPRHQPLTAPLLVITASS